MKNTIVLFFLLFLLSKVNAQNTITGKVTDIENSPIAGATVYLPDLNRGSITDKDGNYYISGLPGGILKVKFSFVGYNTEFQSVDFNSGSIRLDIQLTVAVIQSQEVVVSGGYVSTQHENAIKIDVLSNKDVLLSGTPNFMESLTMVPGIDMISKGQGVSKPVIRGLSMNNVLVMNNGVRIENYQFSENHPLGVDGSGIERIEVIKGPASLLYGSDAIGGVLNFVGEKSAPTGKIVGDFRSQFHSNTLGINNSIGIKGASEHFFSSMRFGYKSNSDYLQGGGEFVPNTRFNESILNANAGYSGHFGVFKLTYDYFKQNLGMSVPPVVALITDQGRKNEIWYQDLDHHLVSTKNSIYLGEIQWVLNGAFQNALRKLQTTIEDPFVEMALNTITYESELHFPTVFRTEFVAGLQGMSQTNRNLNNRASQFLPDADIRNLGAVGLAKCHVGKIVQIQGGVRFDVYKTETYALGAQGTESYHESLSKDFSDFTGSIGLTINPVHKINLRANFAKAFRVPNLSELTSNGLHGNRYEMGNPDLNPQNGYESDASMHYHGKLLSFDIAGFYNSIQDYIYISPTDDTTSTGYSIYRFSQTNAALFGGEAGFHFHPKQAKWLHFKSTFSSVTGKQDDGSYLPFIPANKLRTEIRIGCKKIGFLIKPNIQFSTLTAFQQDNPSVFETETSGYTLVNVRLNAEIPVAKQRFIVGISVSNLFDEKYIDHLSTLKPMNYYNQGRNMSISLKLPFNLL